MATVTAPASTTRRRRAMPAWVGGLIGIVILIVLWQLVGLSSWGKSHYVPPPTHILAQMRDDGWSLYWPNVREQTGRSFLGNS